MKKKDDETKEQKFARMAPKRVDNALKAIRLVKNLSNKNNYSYDDDQRKKIIRTLEDSVKELKISFNIGGRTKGSFTFD